jgi:hypothetical protein
LTPVVTLTALNGSSLALVLWAKDVSGSDDVAVLHGRMEQRGVRLMLVRSDGNEVELLPEWHGRIKEVADSDVASIVGGARFMLSLSVGNLPDNASPTEFRAMGLKWPE